MMADAEIEGADHPKDLDEEISGLKEDLPLDRWTKEIIDYITVLFMRRVPRRKFNVKAYKEHLKQRFAARVDAVPDWVGDEAADFEPNDDIAGDALSKWGVDEKFTQDGRPRPLPEEGELSLTSLILSVSASANVNEVKNCLLSAGSVKLENGLYHQNMRKLELRKLPGFLAWHGRRVVWTAVKTAEGNARRQEELRRLEFMVVGSVSREMHPRFREQIEEPAMSCLETVEDIVIRSGGSASSSETIDVFVGVIQGDDLPLPPLQPPDASGAGG